MKEVITEKRFFDLGRAPGPERERYINAIADLLIEEHANNVKSAWVKKTYCPYTFATTLELRFDSRAWTGA